MSTRLNLEVFLNSQVGVREHAWAPTGRVSSNWLARVSDYGLWAIPYLFHGRQITVLYKGSLEKNYQNKEELRLELFSIDSKPLFENRALWKTALAVVYVAIIIPCVVALLLKGISYCASSMTKRLHAAAVRHITIREPIVIGKDNPIMTEAGLEGGVITNAISEPHNAPIPAVVIYADGSSHSGHNTVEIRDGWSLQRQVIQRLILCGAKIVAENARKEEQRLYRFLLDNGWHVPVAYPVTTRGQSAPSFVAATSAPNLDAALKMPAPLGPDGKPMKFVIELPMPAPTPVSAGDRKAPQ